MNVERFSLELAEPLETAAGTIERREGFLVRVAVDGVEGVGEATPLPGWTESLDACREALEAVAELDPDTALDAIGPGETPAAAHAVELAVLDARATAAGVSLCEYLCDGDCHDHVPVNATVGDADPETTADAASGATARGFGAVKVKVGSRSVDEDADRLRAVREAVGPDIELRADANGTWSYEQARSALERFAAVDVAYVEQPLPAGDLDGHAALRGGPVGVALDEALRAHDVRDIVGAAAADAVVLKPMVLGGPARAVEAAEAVRKAGVEAVVTTTVDGVYARTAAVHVAATLPDPPACGLATGELLAGDIAADPAPVHDGRIRVPVKPGNLGGTS